MKVFAHLPKNNLDSVKARLHAVLKREDPARPHSNLHASDLTNQDEAWCPRECALLDKHDMVKRGKTLYAHDMVTFRIGHDVQDAVIGWLHDGGLAYTKWRCRPCGWLSEIEAKRNSCPNCKQTGTLNPVEPRFISMLSGISCGIDCFLATESGGLQVLEVKSIDKEKFKELKMPLAEHRLRTQLYLRVIAESNYDGPKINLDTAWVLYVSKGGYGIKDESMAAAGLGRFSPFKEYKVTASSTATDELSQLARSYSDWRVDPSMPPPGRICATPFQKRAKWCPTLKQCFYGD